MGNHGYRRYLEAEVLSADPVGLVNLLYRGALDAIGAARRHLAEGRIGERSWQVTRAWEIVQELSRALDTRAGELSRNLAEIYAYIQQRLLEANAGQADAPLAEVERLLATLAEAWREVGLHHAGPPPEEAAYTPVGCSA
jgi:flagellar protein FliS